jgi:hypothetical protein
LCSHASTRSNTERLIVRLRRRDAPGTELCTGVCASVGANLSAIVGGVLVFGEPIGSGPVGIVGRLLAFGLVIAGAALVPAPLRATSKDGAQQPGAR